MSASQAPPPATDASSQQSDLRSSGMRPQFAPSQEMRFAVVMYGGVSLAIYINGVVQELLSLVRATAPSTPYGNGAPSAALLAADELRGTERVYRQLGQLVEWGPRPDPAATATEGAPIRTRFIVDVLSGSSAGGINAIFLAKALANEQSLQQLKDLWVEQADVAVLVNDNESRKDTSLKAQVPPRSVLNSRRMYWQLLSAFDGMEGTEQDGHSGASRLVDELDCWITATDIRGTTLPIDLFDRFVFERKHKQVFHFVYGNAYARGGDELVNQLQRKTNPFLAFAGRATSAFPFAFEPMELADIDEIVSSDRFSAAYGDYSSDHEDWLPFFAEYLKTGDATPVDGEAKQDDPTAAARREAYRTQAFGDGGYLDNKPFTWATATLDRRRADLPVDRRLLYIEPDPGGPRALVKPDVDEWIAHGPLATSAGPAPARPNPLENVEAALIGLPRYETIREDLERLIERNRELDRALEVTGIVDDASYFGDQLPPPINIDDWRRLPLSRVIAERGLQYGAYHRLKIASVLDDLANVVTHVSGFDESSDEYSAIRCFLQAWAQSRFPEEGEGDASQNEYLLRYDLGYRLRRIDFLQTRIDRLLRGDGKSLELLRVLEPHLDEPSLEAWAEIRPTLLELKQQLSETLVSLRQAGRALRSRQSGNPLLAELHKLGLGRAELRNILNGAPSKQASVDRAKQLLAGNAALYQSVNRVADLVATQLEQALDDARTTIARALGTISGEQPLLTVVRRLLQRSFDHYEQYDSVLFPLVYQRLGETDRVEIIRISPEDATDIINEPAGPRRKLGGTELRHFGGFFDRSWRRNDLLWGRLDAAERIITTILPRGSTRTRLLEEAQLAIVEQEFNQTSRDELLEALLACALGRGEAEQTEKALTEEHKQRLREAVANVREPRQILDFLKSGYDVDRHLDPRPTLRTAARAARVTGKVLDGITKQEPVGWVTRWLGRVALVLWGLVEISTPQRMPFYLWQYWRQLLLLFSIAMIVLGLVFNIDPLTHTGWIGVGLTVAVWLTAWLLQDVFARAAKPASPLPPTLPPPTPPQPPETKGQRAWRILRGSALRILVLVGLVALMLAAVEVLRHLGSDLHTLGQWIVHQPERLVHWFEHRSR